MGYALWICGGLAWAQGTHEYKPAGVAVVSATDLFRQRDFSNLRPCPKLPDHSYQGLFASLVDVNDWLSRLRTARSRSHPTEA
jgi:hypothetical protein